LKSADALEFFSALVSRLTGKPEDGKQPALKVDLGKLIALEGVKEFPSRVKCATLAWHAMNSAIQHQSEPVSTE